MLRSGTAYSIPGRSLDLGEGGIAVILGGEVHPSDAVGVEFPLPDLGLGVQAKAVVRHYAPLRCGFEFQGLTRHQQAVIRDWTRQILQGKGPNRAPASALPELVEQPVKAPLRANSQRFSFHQRRLLKILGVIIVLTGLAIWWRWQKGWKDLEEQLPRVTGQLSSPAPVYHPDALLHHSGLNS